MTHNDAAALSAALEPLATDWVKGYFPRGASVQSIAKQGFKAGYRAAMEHITQLAIDHDAVIMAECDACQRKQHKHTFAELIQQEGTDDNRSDR